MTSPNPGSLEVQASPGLVSPINLEYIQEYLRGLKGVALPDDSESDGFITAPESTQPEPNGEGDTSLPFAGSSSTSGDEVDDDFTPLEYARHHGLSRDYLSEFSATTHLEALRESLDDNIYDDTLPQFDFGVEPRLDERMMLSKDAARLLQAVAHDVTQDTINALMFPLLSSSDVGRARVELPLLKTDHETDCKEFARWDGFEINLKDITFPLEVVDDEKNEGIPFPSACWNLGDKVIDDLEKEKLEVTRDTLLFLQATLKNLWTNEDNEEMWRRETKYKRNTALDPVTPPLFPMSPPILPYEPSSSSPGFHLETLSDPPSLIKEDLQAVENAIFKQDIPTPIRNGIFNQPNESSSSPNTVAGDTAIKLSDIYPPMAFLDHNTPPALETERVKPEDLKIEGPLTPAHPITALPKTVTWSEVIEEIALAAPTPVTSPPSETFFQDAFGGAAERVKQQLEQETLVDADTTARVDIPKMETVSTNPPWRDFQQCKSSVDLLAMQMQIMMDIPVPKRIPKIQEKVRYNPFPHDLAKVALEDLFEGSDEIWKAFVAIPKDEEIVDSSVLTWKPPGLRILKEEEDDDDEIEPGRFVRDQPRDMSYLIKKRKLELNQEAEETQQAPPKKPSTEAGNALQTKPRRSNVSKLNDFMTAGDKMQIDELEEGGLLLGGRFSAENMLGNFMELRGVKRKLHDSAYFSTSDPKGQLGGSRNPTPAMPAQVAAFQLPIRLSPVAKQNPLPAPAIVSTSPQSIIVSSTLLRHRALIKCLEKLLPELTLVERNFSAPNTTAWLPGSVTRSPVTSPLDSEADLIISPSTGIVITTLQRLKQKPLPGSKAKPEVRARLEKVSTRYEKLVVLVTEGRKDESTNGLDEFDCLALSEFMGYTAGLVAATTVQFIGGGEETLGKWLASAVAQHRVENIELLPEETHWELFLRRAGLNAFAAQEILGKLKAPDGVDATSPSKAGMFGLAAFVEMGPDERMARFGDICGKGLIERVSALVDARWE